MPVSDYPALVARQREYFLSGQTRPVAWRKSQLEAVKALFTENHDELCDVLWKDLHRNVIDADLIDVAYCAREAEYALQYLADWMKPQHAPVPLVFQPGRIRVRRDPFGVTQPNSTLPRPCWWMFRRIHPSCRRKCSARSNAITDCGFRIADYGLATKR